MLNLDSKIPKFYSFSIEIANDLELICRGSKVRSILPLAEGFGYLVPTTSSLELELNSLLQLGKTIVIEHLKIENIVKHLEKLEALYQLQFVIHVHGQLLNFSEISQASHLFANEISTLFILSEEYILRRFLHHRVQSENVLPNISTITPVQTIHVVGLGPSKQLVSFGAIQWLKSGMDTVAFDRTLSNILSPIEIAGKLHLVKYVYEDFSPNIFQLNSILAELQATGTTEVVLLIEGNPELYDFVECLSWYKRNFVFEEVTRPYVLVSCQWLEMIYDTKLLASGYIVTSGFNYRQGITTHQLIEELNSYLKTKLTCLVMEMYCGDISLVLSIVQRSLRPKSVIILTNMFSPEQRVFFLPHNDLGLVDWANSIKGRFTTLVVVDEEVLEPSSKAYKAMLQSLGSFPS